MKPHASLTARPRSVRGTRRRAERGVALLMALALIAFITAAALVSLRAVSTESALQGNERRAREAFFAAQAGLAEGREVVRLRLGGRNEFNTVINNLGGPATDLPPDITIPWYQVIGWTPYTLTSTPAGTAVDPTFAGANREMNGPDGVRLEDFPESSNVRYRVFLVDDDDADPLRSVDENSKVWLVSVGEVTGPAGSQPHRSIVRTLINAGTSGGSGPPCWDAGCEDNGGG
ncbi:hypothetical protein [Pyxidicoccus xibeiensis]|uniref:hypothetical protein n=1 Tax=Pyxidicoccus xibeiensis TaxID=2906759 RepID=UPI0020A7D6E0|nr:hypothetical protein [Pyxidicoccus xibeiensis]MCP3144156.1 hypothetical protein [Pyxidicoccus xibeiensis]